jgi:hypothetical protein
MRFAACLAFILCCGAASQTPPPDPQPSLADLAKKARDAHPSPPKASRTFDNDSMKKAPPGTPDRPITAKPSTPGPQSTDTATLEKTYRAKFSQLRSSLKTAEADDQRLHADLATVAPNSATVLHPYYDPGTIQSLQSQIDGNSKKIATLKTQLDDLTDELRKKGLPPRWGYP